MVALRSLDNEVGGINFWDGSIFAVKTAFEKLEAIMGSAILTRLGSEISSS